MGVLEEFLIQCEEIISHEKRMKEADASKYNDSTIEAEKQEIQDLWSDWKEIYKKCNTDPDCQKSDKTTIKKKKIEIQTKYMNCVTIIGEWKDKASSPPVSQKTSSS